MNSVERKVLEFMEQEYVRVGYMYSGGITINDQRLAKIIGDNHPVDVMFSMAKKGLIEKRKCEALAFQLTAQKRLQLIQKHNLAVEWEKTAPFFYPNSPHGEVTSVYKETQTPLPIRPYGISKKGKPLY